MVVAHDRGAAVEEVVRLLEPLLCHEEAAQIRHDLCRRLDDLVMNGLGDAVGVLDGQPRTPPSPALYVERTPSLRCGAGGGDSQRIGRLDKNGPHVSVVFQEQPCLEVHREHVPGHAHGDRPAVG